MKLLLRKSVDKLGEIGSVVTVADGYARNYLLPKRLAAHVTPGGLQQIEIEKKKVEAARREENANLLSIAESLRDVACTITARANEDGKLFGSVSAQMIADTLQSDGFAVDESMVALDEPIKRCDVFNVPIAVSQEIKTTIKLWVVSEDNGEADQNKVEGA